MLGHDFQWAMFQIVAVPRFIAHFLWEKKLSPLAIIGEKTVLGQRVEGG